MKKILFITLLIQLLIQTYQYQPIIGILTQPSNDLNSTQYPPSKYQYISSSYVKWIEASGGRPIAIPYDISDQEIDFYLSKINGIVFPGGNASLWEYEPSATGFANMTITGTKILKKVIQMNQNGTFFPLLGTCLGYELIVLGLTGNEKVLDHLNSTNHVLNTHVFLNISSVYSQFQPSSIDYIQKGKALFYNHRYGLSLKTFFGNKILSEFFNLSAFSTDSNGVKFVSSLEGKDFPVFVNQFHPEKNSYEWLESVHANHSKEAVLVGQEFGNWFVGLARQNGNVFGEKEVVQNEVAY
ncbi:peptidase C26 family protein, putative [Ichthyophthirius multifiliis]|uniref:folate gamma-glutamyl hydrolase n=1 Tax=Ichthyophthirius multifiliis TaxID=5932 RepID=G0QJM1_ICHMU|nr:peptidase C26 family protein, putative [Ichthyophthirius multifiliis]EGR34587.1 peptidase C26 family protein, putative [Ichthyophthirius multifiliis]|eukprot:XP_004039891.1 peptidase C26 family protein, putative [Ichthyophthirius multifiliis]